MDVLHETHQRSFPRNGWQSDGLSQRHSFGSHARKHFVCHGAFCARAGLISFDDYISSGGNIPVRGKRELCCSRFQSSRDDFSHLQDELTFCGMSRKTRLQVLAKLSREENRKGHSKKEDCVPHFPLHKLLLFPKEKKENVFHGER